ncbi:MAG TPA: response regulator, partial [Bdellovibrionota bacterium]|nr:response regulator [Bdellovibrionota bacterium]
MSRILVVEDDASFRGVIKKLLENAGYAISEAGDGKEAQGILALEDFDLVVSDIRMPNLNGIELLHWIKKTKPGPVILMTGFSEITETGEAIELGADGFIPKPFKKEDLLTQIRVALGEPAASDAPSAGGQPATAKTDGESEFMKIPIEDFVSGAKIPYNIFLKLPSGQVVKIAYKGEDISLDRIKAYKTRGLNNLWLKKEDFGEYVGMNLKIARRLGQASFISKEKKRNFLRHTGEVILEKLYVDHASREDFDDVKDYTKSVLSVISEHDDIFNLLDLLNEHADHLYAHSVAVSMYS